MKLLKRTQNITPPSYKNDYLTTLINSLNDVVFIINNEHQIEFINACWETLTGRSVATTINHYFTDFVHPEDINKWQTSLHDFQAGEVRVIWLRVLSDDKTLRWCEIRIQPMQAESVYPLSATLCDITPQVRHEQTQQADHRSLKSLVNRLPAMLYRSRNNKSWSLEYVSEGCQTITGYNVDTLLNQPQITLGSLIHEDDADHVWEHVQIALQTQDQFDLDYRLYRADGSLINVKDKGIGLYTDSGLVLGVEGIIFQV